MPSIVAQTMVRQLNAAREHVNLVGALTNVAEQALDGIGRFDVTVHRLRKVVKGQRLVFVLEQAAHGLWIALAVFGLEGSQLDHGFLFARLIPDVFELSLNITSLSSRDGIQHIALFM